MKEEREDVTAHKERTHSTSPGIEQAESCAVCTTKLSFRAEPKLLPCLHMTCKACIINTAEDKNVKDCPVCGKSFNLSEVTDCFIFEDAAPKCGGCDDSALSGWCKECEEALCSDCVSAHQRVKVTRNHTVIPQEPYSGLSTSLRCTSHKQENLKFFCVTCDQLTCRDCQLIDHRNHSFLWLEEAVVSQKDHLMKLLDSIREQKNSVTTRLQDLDGRLSDIKELKASSQKKLHKVLCSVYHSLVLRYRHLSKELEGLCDEEEKSLKVMKTNLKNLEDRQEYITAFLQKILSTKGQCILRHKIQIDKWVQWVLSQKNLLPDSVIQISLSLNEEICDGIKNFGSFKVTRVPLTANGKHNNDNKSKNAPEETDICPSGLNSDSGTTLSVSDTASIQATAHSMSQAASDLPQCGQSESTSSKPVQPTQDITDTMSYTSSSSESHNFASLKTTQSNMSQTVVAQVGQYWPKSASPQSSQSQQVFRNLSFKSSTSLPGQKILNIIPSNLPQHGLVMPQGVLPQSKFGVVIAAAAPQGPASLPSVAYPPVLIQTASFQSSHLNSLTNTQSHFLPSNQYVASLPYHTQQSIPQTQAVSSQSLSSRIAPINTSLPYTQAFSKTQSVNPQPSQSACTPSNQLKVTLLQVPNNIASLNTGTAWKVYHCTPALTVNNSTTPCVPHSTNQVWIRDGEASHPTSGNVSCPQDPRLTVLPVSTSNKLDPPLSSMPPHPAAPIPSAYNNAGQIECATQTIKMPNCELPVKAPADSLCEGDMSVCSSASPVAEEADSNLPTSTVLEKDTEARELPAMAQDAPSTTSIKGCPPHQSFLTQSELPLKSKSNLSSTGNSSTNDLQKASREIFSSEIKVPAKDAGSGSALEHTSLPSSEEDNDEKTDDSDSELVEGMDEAEEEPILRQDCNKTLFVSLLRLPISVSSPSQFRILPSSQKTEILLQDIEENQRCLRIPAPPAVASPSHFCSSERSVQADVLDCAVCHSAGASLQCVECGRSFHTSCHVPPILFNPKAMWVCSLCQDVLDDTDPFSCDRLKEPYLSLSDQRRCEQVLLTLMCENHSYLLYKSFKQTAGCLEFNLIVGRLLGKCSPPYRSAAEMVSDLWALFDNLSSKSKKKDLVYKLQSSFQQRLKVSFGKSLHASLLRPLSSRHQMGAPKTEPDQEKARNTLKRMRAFLAAKCTVVPKKAHTECT